jgi:hypothetical protein
MSLRALGWFECPHQWGLAMTTKNRLHILMLAAFAGTTLVPAYATADDAQSERLQRQIDAL